MVLQVGLAYGVPSGRRMASQAAGWSRVRGFGCRRRAVARRRQPLEACAVPCNRGPPPGARHAPRRPSRHRLLGPRATLLVMILIFDVAVGPSGGAEASVCVCVCVQASKQASSKQESYWQAPHLCATRLSIDVLTSGLLDYLPRDESSAASIMAQCTRRLCVLTPWWGVG